jgi:2-amino-4-hydroxy-6-hydroxymethyldihydropteridine diphosphokinase
VFLARWIDERHTIYTNHTFPTKKSSTKRFRHRVILGIGGNVGDTRRRMEHLWIYLGKLPQISRIQSGVILKNPPFGHIEQADFYNTLIEITTSLQPRALLRLLWRIEKRFGRVRSFENAPRTLDLDMIFFDNRKVSTKELTVPHPCWKERTSVLIPLQSLGQSAQKIRRQL